MRLGARNRAGESSVRPGGFAVEISWRFGLLELGSTSFHREDVVWSGGNLVRASIFAFFAKVIGLKGSRRGSHQLSRSLWESRLGRDTLNHRVLKAVYRAAATTAEWSFPTEPVTREAHPYLLPGEGDPEILRPSSSGGSAPPAV
ncbi:hypothetical protein Taro_050162 [Colocasia esculenta]|uniref:Uncharacterized protein n=1 Tax=Colocasia esculenta TaxID=4460 RepID=A0A843XDB8_COLES|nr:hypothetical protein [Colocasia esculenta]